MRILFCNIAWMDYYKGKVEGLDEPENGRPFVDKYKEAHESYNFSPEYLDADTGYPEGEYCRGFVETKSTNGTTRNQLKKTVRYDVHRGLLENFRFNYSKII